MIFTSHTRPQAIAQQPSVDPVPLPVRTKSVPSITAAEDVSNHRDTFLGDLVFLARFAFGRY